VSVLEEVVAAAGPDLAGHVSSAPGEARFALEDRSRAFVLEAVYEGYLMHYGAPRLFNRLDDDLRLLAGDALYAVGLSRLAATGDLEAVAELSDLISRSARAHVEGRAGEVEPMWDESARILAPSCAP
jgi:hypothetical protein